MRHTAAGSGTRLLRDREERRPRRRSQKADAMAAVFLPRLASEIAVEFGRLLPALLPRISMQSRLLRSRRRRMLVPSRKGRRSGPDKFRQLAHRPLRPKCWLRKESRCYGRIPGVLEADLPAKWEGLIPSQSSGLAE